MVRSETMSEQTQAPQRRLGGPVFYGWTYNVNSGVYYITVDIGHYLIHEDDVEPRDESEEQSHAREWVRYLNSSDAREQVRQRAEHMERVHAKRRAMGIVD
jgi:hypothetical protein